MYTVRLSSAHTVYVDVLVIILYSSAASLDWFGLGVRKYVQYISSNSTYEFLGLKTYHALPLF